MINAEFPESVHKHFFRKDKQPKKYIAPFALNPLRPSRLLSTISDSSAWKLFFFFTIVANFAHVNYCYAYVRNGVALSSYFVIIACDGIYVLNYFFANYTTGKKSKRDKTVLFVDFFLLLPYSYIYEAVYHKSDDLFFFLLRGILFLRLFHIVRYFKRTPTPKRTVFILKYFMIIFLANNVTGLLYFLQQCPLGSTHCGLRFFNASPAEYYTHSLLFGLTYNGGANFGQTKPNNRADQIYTSAAMYFGFVLLFGCIVGSLCHKCAEENEPANNNLIANTPSILKADLYGDVNETLIQYSLLFADKSVNFQKQIARHVKHQLFETHQLIYTSGMVKDKMIVVESGAIEILLDDDSTGPILVLGPGTCLGEIGLVLPMRSKSSVRAACPTHLRVLYRKDFLLVFGSYPEIYEAIYDDIKERVLRAKYTQIANEISAKQNALLLINEPQSDLNKFKDMLAGTPLIEYTEDKYLSLYQSMNAAPIIINQTICLTTKFPWVFQSNTSLVYCWNILVLMVVANVGFLYPYYGIYYRFYPLWLIVCSNIFEFIYVVDLVIITFTAIETRSHKTVKSLMGILHKNLCKFGFYLDLFSCLHLELYANIFKDSERVWYLLKLNRLLKTYRFITFFNQLEHKTKLYILQVKLVKYLVYFLTLSYWFGSLLFLLACRDEVCNVNSWFYKKYENVQNEALDSMLISWFFAMNCMTRLGNVSIFPQTIIEAITIYFIFLFGLFLFVFYLSELFCIISLKKRQLKQIRYDRNVLERFLKERKSGTFSKRIQSFFLIKSQMDEFKLSDMELYEILRKIPLFSNTNPEFVRYLSKSASTSIISPNETILYEGEPHDYIYIIVDGFCVCKNERGNHIMGPKAYFGNIAILAKTISPYKVEALTHATLIQLEERNIRKIFTIFESMEQLYQQTVHEVNFKPSTRKLPMDASALQYFIGPSGKEPIINVATYCRANNEPYIKYHNKYKVSWILQLMTLPLCCPPYSKILQIWLFFRAFIAIWIAILIPLQITELEPAVLRKFNFFIESLQFADLYLMLFVGYYGKRQQLIVHPIETGLRYLKSRFIVDLVFCLPWDLLLKIAEFEKNVYLPVKILKMGQLYRIEQIFKFFIKKLNKQIWLLEIARLLLYFILLINFCATVLIASSCLNLNSSTCWFTKHENVTLSISNLYVMSYYYTTVDLIGYAINKPTSESTDFYFLNIFIMVTGILFSSYLFANIANILQTPHRTQLIKFKQNISKLKVYMKNESVSPSLIYIIMKHFNLYWQKSKRNNFMLISNNINLAFRKDLLLKIYSDVFHFIEFYDEIDSSFFRLLANDFEIVYFCENESILRREDVTSYIYIITSGQVNVYQEFELIEKLTLGSLFGNLTLIAKNRISESFVANTDVECLAIDNKKFFTVAAKYPKLCTSFESLIDSNLSFIASKTRMGSTIETLTENENKFEDGLSVNSNNCKNCIYLFFPWKWCKLTFSPNFCFFKFMDVVCAYGAIINCFLVTYQLTFQFNNLVLLLLGVGIDLIFYLKLFLEMHNTSRSKFDKRLSNRFKTAICFKSLNKFKVMLYSLGNIPLHLFSISFENRAYYIYLRAFTIFKILYTIEYYEIKTKNVQTRNYFLKIIMTSLLSLFAIYLLSCGWYLTANLALKKQFADYDKFDLFIASLYLMTAICTATGAPELKLENINEYIYVMCALICSCFLIGLFIGVSVLIYKEAAGVQQKYYILKETSVNYLRQEHVNNNIIRKFKQFSQQLWNYNKGVQMPKLINKLPYVLHCELMMDVYGYLIKNSYIFSETEAPFIRQLAFYIRRSLYFRGDFITRNGEANETMYFIYMGEIDILTKTDNVTEIIHEVLYSGDMFGLVQGLFYNVPHHFSFRARSHTIIVSLCLSDWEDLLRFFPHSKQVIYSKATDMYNNINM